MTWGETASVNVNMKEETKKESRCFALTSIELFDVFSSLARRSFRADSILREASWFFKKSIIKVSCFNEKRRTVEMTWGETAATQRQGKKTR